MLPLRDCFAQEINMFCNLDRFVLLWICINIFKEIRRCFLFVLLLVLENLEFFCMLSSMFVRLHYVIVTDWICLISLAGQSKDH